MEYDNRNTGVLFINDRKESERHPDWKGKVNIDGTEYWLSGWKKQGQKGPFLSLSVGAPVESREKPPEPAPRSAPRSTTSKYPPSTHPADDSEIPW